VNGSEETAQVAPPVGRADRVAFAVTATVALGVYLFTLAPSVTLEFSGELAVAADHLGVPHTPGYPVWTLLAWAFHKIFWFVRYLGQPNPAWGIAMLSAAGGALTCGLTALLVSLAGKRRGNPGSSIAGIAAGLTLAFSPALWSQAVIVETHMLKNAFQAVLFALAYLWLAKPTANRWLYLGAFLFGAALSTHPPIILVFIPLVVCLLLGDWRIGRDFLLGAALFTAAAVLAWNGILRPVAEPEPWRFLACAGLDLAVVAIVFLALPRGGLAAGMLVAFQVGLLFLLYLPIASDMNPPLNWGYPRTWAGFLHTVNRGQFERLSFFPWFCTQYLAQVRTYLNELVTQFSLPVCLIGLPGLFYLFRRNRRWCAVVAAGFLALALIPANVVNLPHGDLHHRYFVRTYFIQSYAVFALLVGAALAALLNAAWRRRGIGWGAACLALALPAIPLVRNAADRELIRQYGGADQNGHDFGWQFGNFQLRGAAAIIEELSADEEPLPNPRYPPAMEPDAILFGGTDPGRFVLTYMVFSARVRPDVYVLTQNALADNSYLCGIRDLYGDRIYLPSQEDAVAAYGRYVEEVRSGKREPNAELKIEGGGVHVMGALAVMEINGILAGDIVERNSATHACYIEESYVIPWMWPHLEPHGLIMKVNAEPSMLTDEMVRNDGDFWDWYTRRLHGNRRFRRDVAARKSFCKLRTALAGLCLYRGRPVGAEDGYQQARLLYPQSPEANFRLVQEVLMGQGRFAEGKDFMLEFGRQDPGDDRVRVFVDYLQRLADLQRRASDLEQKRQTGAMDVMDALELAQCYLQLQRRSEFNLMVAGILASTNLPGQFYYKAATLVHEAKEYNTLGHALDVCAGALPSNSPPDVYLNMARMYYDAKRVDKTAEFLQEYLKRNPADWKAWLDLAAIYLGLQRTDAASRALEQAKAHGGAEAARAIRGESRFAGVRPALSDEARAGPQGR